MALLISIALAQVFQRLTSTVDRESEETGYNPLMRVESKRYHVFLYAYFWSFLRQFRSLINKGIVKSQVTLLLIRQALFEIRFGRGMIHG